MLHGEDLGASNATRILNRYRDDDCTFNDDIQGTAAADAVARTVDARRRGASLLPEVTGLRALSAKVARAVIAAAVADGVAGVVPDNPIQAIQDTMWKPQYTAIEAV